MRAWVRCRSWRLAPGLKDLAIYGATPSPPLVGTSRITGSWSVRPEKKALTVMPVATHLNPDKPPSHPSIKFYKGVQGGQRLGHLSVRCPSLVACLSMRSPWPRCPHPWRHGIGCWYRSCQPGQETISLAALSSPLGPRGPAEKQFACLCGVPVSERNPTGHRDRSSALLPSAARRCARRCSGCRTFGDVPLHDSSRPQGATAAAETVRCPAPVPQVRVSLATGHDALNKPHRW